MGGRYVLKYSIDMHELIFPKYAKLQFKINKAGNLTIAASPSITPGQMPEGIKPGAVPKGTKIFNYDAQIVTSLTFSDCLAILDFISSANVAKTVDIYRKSSKYDKKLTFAYTPSETDASKPKFLTLYFSSIDNGKENKFKLPLSLASLAEVYKIIDSYVLNFAMIKLFCQADLQNSGISDNYNRDSEDEAMGE